MRRRVMSQTQKEKSGKKSEAKAAFLASKHPNWENGHPPLPGCGRPKGAKDGLRAHARRILRKALPGEMISEMRRRGLDVTDPVYAALIAQKMAVVAAGGSVSAAKFLADLTEEPLKQTIEQTGTANVTLVIEPVATKGSPEGDEKPDAAPDKGDPDKDAEGQP